MKMKFDVLVCVFNRTRHWAHNPHVRPPNSMCSWVRLWVCMRVYRKTNMPSISLRHANILYAIYSTIQFSLSSKRKLPHITWRIPDSRSSRSYSSSSSFIPLLVFDALLAGSRLMLAMVFCSYLSTCALHSILVHLFDWIDVKRGNAGVGYAHVYVYSKVIVKKYNNIT